MVSKALFSSDKMDWGTPEQLFRELHSEFRFTVDAAATPANNLLPRFFCDPNYLTPLERESAIFEVDGLAQDWTGERVWINPPYGRDIGDWIAKGAAFEADVSVFLIPSRTDTNYWHTHIWDRTYHRPRAGVQVRFLKGRVRFKGATAGAPFPSVVVVFSRMFKDASTPIPALAAYQLKRSA